MDRREFLKRATKTGVSAGLSATGIARLTGRVEAQVDQNKSGYKKAVVLSMLSGDLSMTEKFKMARDAGFDGVEIPPPVAPGAVDEAKAAVEASGIPAHSIIFGGWGKPLSHPDAAVADEGLEELKAALKAAKEVGADGLLLVPAIVNKQTRYVDAYERSQKRIKQALPLARQLDVKINIEEVWNKFLLSPLEFAQYIDDFKSPYCRAYFDVANVIDFGWPEDWILTLGKRIEKVHLKDFKRDGRQWVPLGEGDADYPTVMKALDEVGFKGWLTCELPGGDAEYLKEVSRRVDRIIAGKPPAG